MKDKGVGSLIIYVAIRRLYLYRHTLAVRTWVNAILYCHL